MTKWHKGKPAEWVTEVEPEYDVNERDNWQALAEYEEALCPQCNRLRVVCEDPKQQWAPQLHECRASAVAMAANRRWGRLHDKDKPDRYDRLPADGTRIWVAPAELAPDDTDFLKLVDDTGGADGFSADTLSSPGQHTLTNQRESEDQ